MKLIIKGLNARALGKEIIKNISLTIGPGELHILMGPNGSGKSTLARAVGGHPDYKTTCTSMKLGSKNLLVLKPFERARAGLFLGFQSPPTLSGISLLQLLKSKNGNSQNISGLYTKIKKQAGLLKLKQSLLTESLNENFSGGEQKKIEIVQLINFQAKFAILDEPDAGLDVDAIKLVAAQIGQVLKVGCGVLLITHQSRILKYLKPSKVHILMDGSVVESGGINLIEAVEKEGYAVFGR